MILARPVPIREWRPDLPSGDLRSISLHWTAGDYTTVYPAYHFVLAGADDVVVHHTHDLRENMREVYKAPELPYAAHTRGRNSFSIGISIAAMRDSTPSDFGVYPLTEAQLEAICVLSAGLARFYGIEVAAIRTHAEAALDDGYFGAGTDDVRWDIARLRPSADPLQPHEATVTGDWFRSRIAELLVLAR
jgi:hypothetical protein